MYAANNAVCVAGAMADVLAISSQATQPIPAKNVRLVIQASLSLDHPSVGIYSSLFILSCFLVTCLLCTSCTRYYTLYAVAGCVQFITSCLWFILLVCGSLMVACGVSIVLKDGTRQSTATDVSRLPLPPPPTLLLLSFQDPVLPIAPAAFAITLFIAAAAAPLS